MPSSLVLCLMCLITLSVAQDQFQQVKDLVCKNFPCTKEMCAQQQMWCNLCSCSVSVECLTVKCGYGQKCQTIKSRGWFSRSVATCVDDPNFQPTTEETTATSTTTVTPPPTDARSGDLCTNGRQCRTNDDCDLQDRCLLNSGGESGVCCKKEIVNLSPRCREKMSIGPCRASFRKYFYNITASQCQGFIYGGCDANENNFDSVEDCQKECENPCLLPMDRGFCRAILSNFFFNSTSGKCQEFDYGGCGGNPNNWKSMEECEQRCMSA
ncbi:papilin-like [Haliotis rubra]|uniref:papilin-like n=1 Tax=Haliotis rubra TaxID=36100 RepID=UPI001EE52804|nr:papilin-like [Haliotis rubra]